MEKKTPNSTPPDGFSYQAGILSPESVYLLRGPARSEWEHSIPAVDALRYSITFRALEQARRRKPVGP